MSTLQFTSDIVNDVLFRAGEPTDGTSDFEAQALQYINRAYRAVWMGGGEFVPGMTEPWLWLKKDPPGVFVLQPSIDDGTIAVTNNSASVTFSVAPSVSLAGRFLQVEGGPVFRILSHTALSTSATLDSVYTEETNSAAQYAAMKLEYDLPADCLRVIAPMRGYTDSRHEVIGTDLLSMDREFPLHEIRGGAPTRFSLVTESKVRFNTYGGSAAEELIRLEFDYHAKPSDLTDSPSEEPLIPLQYRQILADLALFLMWTVKNDDRAVDVGAQGIAGLKAMQSDNRSRLNQSGGRVGHIYPRATAGTLGRRVLRVG